MARRLFLAIPLPEKVAAAATRSCDPLRTRCPRARWTREENLHATVLFLGDVEDGQLETLTPVFREAFGAVAPFALEARGIVTGPSSRRPTMLWLGFKESADFSALAGTAFDVASRTLDLPPLRSDPAPHVTLARFKDALPAPCAAAAGQVRFAERFMARGCGLIESHLSSDGPTYVTLENLEFNKT